MRLDRDICYRALLTRDARFDGQFFVAVRTTGIYCRPVCPVPTPRLANIIFVPSAAAAQAAGFRPCLRCRPETSPDLAAWHGTSSTVSRAMALIGSGALDHENVVGLAGRLGIGERQLRRLFQKHLGASPKAVAQTRRILFAKQLITDTPLPMTEVALAAGFGSVRRFNDTFRKLYKRPPRRLRRAGAAAEITGSAISLTLPYKPPYDWPAIIGFLGARAIPGVERADADVYVRTIAIDEAQGTICVRPHPRAHALLATIRFPVVTALPAIVERIRRIFDLGADPTTIVAHLSEDAQLATLVSRRPGLRVPGAWDGFELAVRGILGQQITIGAATRLAGKLVAVYGTPIAGTDEPDLAGLTHVFPAPQTLVRADIAAAIGMPAARGAAVAGVASAAAADAQLFEPGRDLDDAITRLCALPGIGEWTAQYIAMRALREPDAFPAADIGLMRAMATPTGRPTATQLLTHAAAWRPWRAYAAMHLWVSDAISRRTIRKQPDETAARPPALSDRDIAARL